MSEAITPGDVRMSVTPSTRDATTAGDVKINVVATLTGTPSTPLSRESSALSFPEDRQEDRGVMDGGLDETDLTGGIDVIDGVDVEEICDRTERDDGLRSEAREPARQATTAPPREKWELCGRGSGGFVYKVQLKSGVDVALKELHGGRSAHGEFEAMDACDHENLLKPLAHSGSVIIFPYMKGGSLRNLLKGVEGRQEQLSDYEVARITKGVVGGVDHLHSNNRVHGDLKPDNVLLSDERVVVTDFGPNCGGEGWIACAPAYRAPELCDTSPAPYSASCDMWAVGCIMLTLMFGRCNLSSFYDDWNGLQIPEEPVGRSPALYDLMKKLLSREPAARPTAREALEALGSLKL